MHVQIMIRIQEDVDDCRRRVRQYENEREINEGEWPVAILLDLRKAYPRVRERERDYKVRV